ncbi:MAG TPA: gamma-glutamyl-gamma-aminobutyrate hydrolase family protein [Actinomycetes bacterium]|nr:gamma-glutamyl-gamma-aminobutyrate hydrolase family protein [Actinomycetes bacterium]
MSRPVIGISAYRERARWGPWDVDAVLVPDAYVQHVVRAGALPVLIPPGLAYADEVLDRLDGLILAGGADIDPARYGAEIRPETTGLRPDRDASELRLAEASAHRDLPTLGICRGLQVMVVASGGRLHQHLPDLVGHEEHRPAPGTYGEHCVSLTPGTRLHQVLGDRVVVSSSHHQGVDDAGRLTISGHADDGSVEAVEDPNRCFALGVLWHPEVRDDPRLFEALVDAATR